MPKELIKKENVSWPETLLTSKPQLQNGHSESPQECKIQAQSTDSPQKPKIERMKSILKQSSKEKGETPELTSPKRENITFASEISMQHNAEEDILPQNDPEKIVKRDEVENQVQCNLMSNETVETQTCNTTVVNESKKGTSETKDAGKLLFKLEN